MAEHKYSFQNYDKEKMARAVGRSLSVSTKYCIEISNYLRGKKLSKAKILLQDAADLKKPIPFKRFTDGVGHKKGSDINSGRYACNAATQVLKVLENCEKNALNKGLNAEDLVIIHINANKAGQQWHYGRQRRRRMKRTHVEIVLEEVTSEKKAKKAAPKKVATKPVKPAKKETKPVAKKEEPKVEKKTEEKKTEEKKVTPKEATKNDVQPKEDSSKE